MLSWNAKDPDEVLDYRLDWTDRLAGDTISTSVWAAESGITIDSDVHDDTAATVWVSGGTHGTTYRMTNTITTAAGRTMQEVVLLPCVSK